MRWCKGLQRALLLGFVAAAAPPATIVLPDAKLYTKAPYSAYAAPFSADVDRSLRRGLDYLDTVTIQPDRFPDNTRFDMRWPSRSMIPTGVWGYFALSYGNYGGGPVDKLIKPRRARDIAQLSATFDYAASGSANFNLLTEFFLTSRPGDATAKVHEIGYLLHVAAVTASFMKRGRAIGNFRDRFGRTWRMVRVGTYFMIVPLDGRTVTHGAIDYALPIHLLAARGEISGDEWFNGVAFGAEPTAGGGATSLLVRRWRITSR